MFGMKPDFANFLAAQESLKRLREDETNSTHESETQTYKRIKQDDSYNSEVNNGQSSSHGNGSIPNFYSTLPWAQPPEHSRSSFQQFSSTSASPYTNEGVTTSNAAQDLNNWVFPSHFADLLSEENREASNSIVSSSSAKTKTGRNPRTIFTGAQIQELEMRFQEAKYLNDLEWAELSAQLGLSEMQVKVWFKNRRAKTKKQLQ